MKKLLFSFVLVLSLVLVGCNGNKKPPKPTEPEVKLTKEVYSVMVEAEVELEYTSEKTVEFTSKNPEIATVDDAGKVKGVKVGKATITLKVGETEVIATVNVSTTITVNDEAVNLEVGETHSLDATTKGATLEYTSSKEEVVTVSEAGVITAVGAGSATVTISLKEDAEVSKTVEVTVTEIKAEEKDFLKAKANTEALTNYTVKITIKEDGNEVVVYYKFDGTRFEYKTANYSTFYEFAGGKYTKYEYTINGYVEESVEALPSGFIPFWFNLEFANFDYANQEYALKDVKAFSSFTDQFAGATLSNGSLKLGNYYNDISFNLKLSSGENIDFTFEFVEINETVVEIPS